MVEQGYDVVDSITIQAVGNATEGEVGVVWRFGRVEVSVFDGDGKASGVEQVRQLKHWVQVALKWQWEHY